MYAKSALLTLAVSTAVQAAVLPRGKVITEPSHGVPSGTWTITDFDIRQQFPDTQYSTYELDISSPGDPYPSSAKILTSCFQSTGAPGSAELALEGFPNSPCKDPSVSWSFGVNETGYTMKIKHNWGVTIKHPTGFDAYDNVTDTATAFFPKSDLKAPEGSAGERIDAPRAFDLEYYRYIS